MSENVIVQGVSMSKGAAENVQETGVDVAADLEALRSGAKSRKSLLDECLDGADDDRVDGWRDYAMALELHLDGCHAVAGV